MRGSASEQTGSTLETHKEGVYVGLLAGSAQGESVTGMGQRTSALRRLAWARGVDACASDLVRLLDRGWKLKLG